MDEILKGARRNRAIDAPGPACLGAERLAAWAEGALSADEVAAIERHVAGCARCQAMSAVFFATAPDAAQAPAVAPSPAEALRFRPRRLAVWIPIAAGTLAASLLIWIGVRDRQPTIVTDALTKSEPAAPPAAGFGSTRAESTAASPEQSAAKDKADAFARTKREGQLGKQAGPPSRSLQQGNQARADQSRIETPAARELTVGKPVGGGVVGGVAGVARAVPPPPPAVQPVTTQKPTPAPVLAPTPSPAAPPPQPPPPATAASAAEARPTVGTRESLMFRSAVEPALVAQFSSIDSRDSTITGQTGAGFVGGGGGRAGGGAGAGGRGGAGRGGGAARVADAAAAVVHWRILANDTVQRSTDHVTWESVAIDPPAQGLNGGVAPSPNVCWIVGKSGLVLVSADGRRFARVTQPTTGDLIRVAATDALHASVVTTDSRTFETADGGKTWKQAGN